MEVLLHERLYGLPLVLGHAFQLPQTFGQCCMQKTPWCQHITNIGKLNIKHIEQ
jgi:hypothetical protein